MLDGIKPPIAPDVRIRELDGLRGFAVLLVLAWHFFGALVDTDLGWWAKASYHTFILGRTGVDLFFVLSGFLITKIILTRTLSNGRFLQVFYLKRALRILPPYLLLVGVFWGVVASGVNNQVFSYETPFWRHLTFTQNFWMSEKGTWGPSGISVSWSLAIEEHYYLFFPLLALALPRSMLPSALSLIALGSIACRGVVHALNPDNPFLGYVMTFSRLDGLAAGGLVAVAFTNDRMKSWLTENTEKLKIFLWAMLGIIPLLGFAIKQDIVTHMFFWGHTYLTLLYATVIVMVLLNIEVSSTRWLRSRTLYFLGKISYSVYLFHPLFLASFFLIAQRQERISSWPDAGLAMAALVVTIVSCAALYRYYERPILRVGNQVRY